MACIIIVDVIFIDPIYLSMAGIKIDEQSEKASKFVIQGMTNEGKLFRPSDWAERLCGAMSCFRSEGMIGRHGYEQHSPYVRPILSEGIWSVAVDHHLRTAEPLAYHFVMNFAKDNNLRIINLES